MWSRVCPHLSPIEAYIFCLTCVAGRRHWSEHVRPTAVFDVVELAYHNAWSILYHVRTDQVTVPRQLEGLCLRPIHTTAPDWAARKGHLQLLRWLLHDESEVCTTYAMDFAARNGHFEVLRWLHNRGEMCTDAAANWAAFQGHTRILSWLYAHTPARCCELATMHAAGRGDMEMLEWLHHQNVCCTPSAANFALANGHTCVLAWLATKGCDPSVTKEDISTLERIKILACDTPCAPWD